VKNTRKESEHQGKENNLKDIFFDRSSAQKSVGVRSAKGDFHRSHFADPASSKGDIQALKKSSFSFEKQHFYRAKRFNLNCGTLQVRF
jgi:hypothetical protein